MKRRIPINTPEGALAEANRRRDVSFQTIPNSGPFNDDRFDGMRRDALMALDAANQQLPPEVVAYFQALERRLLEIRFADKKEFLVSSWEQFKA